jgi:hypothetical protein
MANEEDTKCVICGDFGCQGSPAFREDKVFEWLCARCWSIMKFVDIHLEINSSEIRKYSQVQVEKMKLYKGKWVAFLNECRN